MVSASSSARLPNQEVLTEILRLHGEVLSTLRNRGAARSGHVRLRRRAARGDRAVSARLRRGARGAGHHHAYLRERSDQAGQGNGRAYAIVEGAIGTRDALLLPSLGKSREAFTASLVAANAFYLSLASDAADEAQAGTSPRSSRPSRS